MELEKDIEKKEEASKEFEELFSKKSVETETKEKTEITPEGVEVLVKNSSLSSTEKNQNLIEKIKEYSQKINIKYIVIGLLVGIIANISVYHYQSMELQNNSQKFVTGLFYNLSENNNLEKIATNIYLGMKENGWEPTVKISNGNIFAFELNDGGNFTITKNEDLLRTKFHVQVNNFSNAMLRALMIELEPSKMGGTMNFINNKKFDPITNTISFDIDKVGVGILPNFNSLNLPIPSEIVPDTIKLLSPSAIDPNIVTIPVSPNLDNAIKKENKSSNVDQGIMINKSQNKNYNVNVDSSNLKKEEPTKK